MEEAASIVGALGIVAIGIFVIVLALLALFLPYFVYSINKNVQQIQRDVSRAMQREDAKPTIR